MTSYPYNRWPLTQCLFYCIETFCFKRCYDNFVISQMKLQINVEISRRDIDATLDIDGFTIRGGKKTGLSDIQTHRQHNRIIPLSLISSCTT